LQRIQSVKIKDVMKRFPVTVRPDDDLVLASHLMLWSSARHLPVVTEGTRLAGVISERDIFAYQARSADLDWREATVEMAMRPHPETAGPEDSVTEAAGRMADHKIGCLPITEKGQLVGIVTTTDILAAQVQQSMEPVRHWGPQVAQAMTPDPETVRPDDTLLDAAARMQKLRVRHLPVIDVERRVLGILSDRDVRAAIGDPARALESSETRIRIESTRVGNVMTVNPYTVTPDEPCSRVAQRIASVRGSAVPVVDGEDRLVGILSYVDLLRALAADFSEAA
jgi:CBS domain-containing protein